MLTLSGLADLVVTCQLWAEGQALTLPFRTSWKDFSRTYMYVRHAYSTDYSAGIKTSPCLSPIPASSPLPSWCSASGTSKELASQLL